MNNTRRLKLFSLSQNFFHFSLMLFIFLILSCPQTEKKEPVKDVSRPVNIAMYAQHNSIYVNSESDIIVPALKEETTLTNSITVDHENFPETENLFLHIGQEDVPHYLKDTDPWVILEDSYFNMGNMFGLSIHLPNLEDSYEVHIYDNDSNLFRKYTAQKREATLNDYRHFYEEKELEEIKKILPFYIFYFPAWVSHSKQLFKTEIRSEKNEVLFSTYIDYPSIPFIVGSSSIGGRLLQYSGDNPVYIVLYEETDDWEKFGKGYPVKAFFITPVNGYWEGILNIVTNKPYEEIRIILFRMDTDNPNNYSKHVEGYSIFHL